MAAGAHGFVPNDDTSAGDLKNAIAEVLARRLYVSSRVPKTMHRVGLAAARRGLHRLTPRQQEIVLLIGARKSASEISHELGVSPSTVSFHKNNIMRVLGL